MIDSTPAKIKTEAARLFGEHGFKATTVRQISEAASVNVAAINYYFESKDGLLRQLLDEITSESVKPLADVLVLASDFEDFKSKLRVFISALLDQARQQPERVDMVFRNLDFFSKEYPDLFTQSFLVLHQRIVTFFRAAQAKNILSLDIDPTIMTHVLMNSLEGIVRFRTMHPVFGVPNITDPKSADEYTDSFLKCFLYGVRKSC